MRRILAIALLAALAAAPAPAQETEAAVVDWAALDAYDVIEVVTFDAEGNELRATKVWIGLLDGHGWVRTGDSRWLPAVKENPDIAIRAGGVDHPMRAEVLQDEEIRLRLLPVFQEKYGWQQKLLEWFGSGGGLNLIKLTPRAVAESA